MPLSRLADSSLFQFYIRNTRSSSHLFRMSSHRIVSSSTNKYLTSSCMLDRFDAVYRERKKKIQRIFSPTYWLLPLDLVRSAFLLFGLFLLDFLVPYPIRFDSFRDSFIPYINSSFALVTTSPSAPLLILILQYCYYYYYY